VLTTSNLPAAAPGTHYQGWARVGGEWVSFGEIEIGSDARSISIGDDPRLVARPDEVRVTRESGRAGHAPAGETVIGWSR
jgi:hypothetical protein